MLIGELVIIFGHTIISYTYLFISTYYLGVDQVLKNLNHGKIQA